MAITTSVAFHFNAPNKVAYACKLVRKLQRMQVPLVVLTEPSALAVLSHALWSFGDATQFLAHCDTDAPSAVVQRSPTVLAAHMDERLPHRKVLLNLGACVPEGFAHFERVIEVVGNEEQDRQQARARWRTYTAQGYTIERHDLVLKTQE